MVIYTSFFSGLFLGLGLIVAIGSQNAFVIKQAIKKEHHFSIALFGSVSDALLVALGVMGVGSFIQSQTWLLSTAKWGGAIFLLWFAYSSFKSSFQGTSALSLENTGHSNSLKKSLITMFAFTFLNPHVYLDTVLSLGLISTQFIGKDLLFFFVGTVFSSFLWFFSISYFASKISHILNRPKVWRVIDFAIGILMLFIAYRFLFSHS